jgi:MFS family permease
LLWGSYSTEIADTDFWWHLRTGQYIVETQSLPWPDPFSYTSSRGEPSYPGEEQVRYFNLTHEWLAQALWFLVYRLGGFPFLVLWKGALLAGMCSIAGFLAGRLSGNFSIGLLAALAGMPLVKLFAADRPALLSFFLVSLFVLVLDEYREGRAKRALWALVALQWFWANAHGGFFLGWVVWGAYAAGAWRWPPERHKPLWLAAAAAVLVSGLNPNGFGVFQVLANYRQSFLTGMLIEWQRPPLWGPPYLFQALLYLSAAVVGMRFKKVELPHALLLAAFGAASLLAFRNVILIAFLGPVLLAAYGWPALAARLPGRFLILLQRGTAGAIALLLAIGAAQGRLFQLRAAEWKFPTQAAEFIHQNRIAGPIFNSYEYGGYLIWALGPETKTFIDGRALNESVYRDYQRILYSSGTSAEHSQRERNELLAGYGVEAVVMNGFEYVTGVIYPVVLALADARNEEWQLVFADRGAVVFLRSSPRNQALIAGHRLEKSKIVDHLEESCRAYIEHDPELPSCARSLGFLMLQAGDRQRAARALGLYLENISWSDPEAQAAFRQAAAGGG